MGQQDISKDATNSIPHRPKNQKIWVVRASSGQFINHFIESKIVAIGHLDDFNLKDGGLKIDDFTPIKSMLATKDPEKSKSSITSQVNQINAFVNSMSVGDWVITLNSRVLVIGRVLSDAYVDNTSIVKVIRNGNRKEKKHVMAHRVRRHVAWGPVVSRGDLPAAVEVTLFAHQTVFNVDDHWQTIYHLLYPFFVYEDQLYLSTNISQKKAIDNYSMAQMFSLLSGVEAIARTLESADGDVEQSYQEIYSYFASEHLFTLTSKAQFMSPGSIWSKIELTPKGILIFCVCYAMLFGAEIGAIGLKTDGVIDKEMRHKIFDLIVDMKKAHGMDNISEKLKPSLPKNETTPLEDSSLDQVKIAAK